MRQITTGFVVLLLILLTFSASEALDQKELELQAVETITDAAPVVGPVAVPKEKPTDDMWDHLYTFDLGDTSALCLGVEFGNGNWYVTDAGASSASATDNMIQILDADGNLLNRVPQETTSGWGYRDIAYDGQYFYASGNTDVYAFDADGNNVPGMMITGGPINPCRALAYDPATDHFWTASFSSDIFEFDRDGTVIWSGASGITGAYGMAWDDGAPDGPWLWIHDQSGTPSTTVHQFDPINYVMTGVSYNLPLPEGYTSSTAGGLCFTDEWNEDYFVLGALGQSSPNDNVSVYEMYAAGGPPPEFEEIPYAWIEINAERPNYDYMGTNSGIINDDHNVGPFDIGFDFPWYDGVFHNTIRLCSNGFATFTSTYTDYSNNPIPDTPQPNDLVAPYWDDMNPSGTYGHGTVWYYADPGGQFFIAEWDSMAHYGSTVLDEYFTFELILYADGTIDYMYRQIVEGTLTPFPSASVGIENADGTVGLQVTYNGSGPWEPDDETGVRIYPVFTPTAPDLTVHLIPVVYPIQIPASGGSFDFYALIDNNGPNNVEIGAWLEYIDPMGMTSDPLMGPAVINLEGSVTTGWFRTQNVPGTAVAGVYEYVLNLGEYPDEVLFTDSFEFEKMITGDGPWMDNWENYGDPFGVAEIATAEIIPEEYTLFAAYPNPFNPVCTIGYALPHAGKVTLTVYDLQGRKVAELVNGYRDAGFHEAVFDGNGLASGLYIYNLRAGDFSANGKMALIK